MKPIWPAGWMTLKNLEKAVKTAQSASVAKESNGVANGTATAPKTTKSPPKAEAKATTATATATPTSANGKETKSGGINVAVGQKRKFSEKTSGECLVPKKKMPKDGATPATPYTIKELQVNLVPTPIPPGTRTLGIPGPTLAKSAGSGVGIMQPKQATTPTQQPVQRVTDTSIQGELDKLKHLRQIISSQSPKEGGRAAKSIKIESPEKKVPSAASPIAKDPVKSALPAPVAATMPRQAKNFSVSHLTSPVKTSPALSDSAHIPVIINNQSNGVAFLKKEATQQRMSPSMVATAQQQRSAQIGSKAGSNLSQQMSPLSSSFLSTSSSLATSSSHSSNLNSSHSVSRLFPNESAISQSAIANELFRQQQQCLTTTAPAGPVGNGVFTHKTAQKSLSPQKSYPTIYNQQLVSATAMQTAQMSGNAIANWQLSGTQGAQKAGQIINVVSMPHQNNTLFAVPIATNHPQQQQQQQQHTQQQQQLAMSTDLSSIEPTLPIDSNLLFKQHLAAQVSNTSSSSK